MGKTVTAVNRENVAVYNKNKTLIGQYKGPCLVDKKGVAIPHGKGRLEFTSELSAEGLYYDGNFEKGVHHGEGVVTYSPSIIYNELWEKGVRRERTHYTSKGFLEAYPWNRAEEGPLQRQLRKKEEHPFVTELLGYFVSLLQQFKNTLFTESSAPRLWERFRAQLSSMNKDDYLGIIKNSDGRLIGIGRSGIVLTDNIKPKVWFVNWEELQAKPITTRKADWTFSMKTITPGSDCTDLLHKLLPQLKSLLKKHLPQTQDEPLGSALLPLPSHKIPDPGPPTDSSNTPETPTIPLLPPSHKLPDTVPPTYSSSSTPYTPITPTVQPSSRLSVTISDHRPPNQYATIKPDRRNCTIVSTSSSMTEKDDQGLLISRKLPKESRVVMEIGFQLFNLW